MQSSTYFQQHLPSPLLLFQLARQAVKLFFQFFLFGDLYHNHADSRHLTRGVVHREVMHNPVPDIRHRFASQQNTAQNGFYRLSCVPENIAYRLA